MGNFFPMNEPDTTATPAVGNLILYVGTFAFGGKVPGAITALSFCEKSQQVSQPLQVLPMVNPSFFWMHPQHPMLYCVNESKGTPEFPQGTVSLCHIESDGRLHLVRSVPSGGAVPCHLDGTAAWLAVANYNGATVAIFPLDEEGNISGDAALAQHAGGGPHPVRQRQPHPHGVHAASDGSFFAVPDLGTDEVVFYRCGPSFLERCSTLQCPGGSGPRHAAFHPRLPRLYVLTELSNEVLIIDGAPDQPEVIQAFSSLPADFTGTSHAAEILLHPSGRALLTSNRGHDSIAIWSLDEHGQPGEGRHYSARGRCPRSMAITANGHWLAVGLQDSDRIAIFHFDSRKAAIEVHAEIAVPSPASLAWFGCKSLIPLG